MLLQKRCTLSFSTTIRCKKYNNFVVQELEYIYSLYTTISSKKFNKFVVLESEYIYLLYTTIRCNKYSRNVPGNGTLLNVVEFTTKTFAVCSEGLDTVDHFSSSQGVFVLLFFLHIVKWNVVVSLFYLQFLPAIECSAAPHAVDHCNPSQGAVVSMHFHCNFTANIGSVRHFT